MRQLGVQDKTTPQKTTVAQFGEGNFLRAFADYMIDIANEQGVFEGGVAVIKPIPTGSFAPFERQGNAYTVILRGLEKGKQVVKHRIVGSIAQTIDPFADYQRFLALARSEDLRFVISNTTEAGIVYDETDRFDQEPANSFPGKLAQFLYARYRHFGGAPDRGLIILPVELIDGNGDKLADCLRKLIALWSLPPAFAEWVQTACIICNTLVDRIVSGYPAEEAGDLERDLLGYRDELMVVGEPFGIWVIGSPRYKEVARAFPLDRAGMPLVFTDDYRPYRERKVRVLNGAHTPIAPVGFLAGCDTVAQAMADPAVRAFIEKAVYKEIIPVVPKSASLTDEEARAFMERFENPFIRHQLLSIALNSVSKWRARVLPSLKDSFAATGKLPACLTFSLAALAAFYRRGGERGDACLIGERDGARYPIRDDAHILDFFAKHGADPAGQFVPAFLANTAFWGEDLSALGDMSERITAYLTAIEARGMRAALELVTG